MKTNTKWDKYLYLLIILTLLARIIIAFYSGLGIGESYYFGGVMHPSLSYFDQPPLFFWLATLSTKLFGLNSLALRLPSILLFAATTRLMFTIGKKLFNPRSGFFAAAILNISFVFTIPVAIWLQPDASLMFFWLLSFYLLLKIFDLIPGENNQTNIYTLWLLLGLALGLATLSKYHSLFIVTGSLIFILFHKNQWHWFKHPGPYLAILICVIIAIPVIIWNYNNNWASFIFQGSRAGTGSNEIKIRFDWFLRSIIGQSLWIAPWIWIPALLQFWISFRKTNEAAFYSFFFWVSVLPVTFFTLITLWTNTNYHFHWQAPGYILLFILMGDYIHKQMLKSTKLRRYRIKWWAFSSIFMVLFSVAALIYTEKGFLKTFGPKWFTEKFIQLYDPTIEGYDFDDIRYRFEKEGWINNPGLFIITDKWYNAGKIDWPLRGKLPVRVFSHDPRNYEYFDNPKDLAGFDAIVLVKKGRSEKIRNTLLNSFGAIEKLEDLPIQRGGIIEYTFEVLMCFDYNFQKAAY